MKTIPRSKVRPGQIVRWAADKPPGHTYWHRVGPGGKTFCMVKVPSGDITILRKLSDARGVMCCEACGLTVSKSVFMQVTV